jgi:cytochrome oxidase Cu insertion factor (SCO1/SenC/PrrC family)
VEIQNEMERPMVQLITTVLSLLVVVFLPIGVHAGDPYEAFSVIRIQKKAAAEFSLPQVSGKSVKLADFQGEVVLLGFFKTF